MSPATKAIPTRQYRHFKQHVSAKCRGRNRLRSREGMIARRRRWDFWETKNTISLSIVGRLSRRYALDRGHIKLNPADYDRICETSIGIVLLHFSRSRKTDRRYSRSSSASESSNMSSEIHCLSSTTSTPSLSRHSSNERIGKGVKTNPEVSHGTFKPLQISAGSLQGGHAVTLKIWSNHQLLLDLRLRLD